MILRRSAGVLVVGTLWMAACSKERAAARYEGYSGTAAPAYAPAAIPARAGLHSVRQDRASQRFIAVQHMIEIEAREGELQKDWESAIAFCATIRCEVTGSSLVNGAGGAAPLGSVSLRVAPEDLPRLFGHVGKAGRIVQHTTATEDKTDSVIDAEAKIKNLTSYRDSLRGLLTRSSASLKDLVEIQEHLSTVQAELDGEIAKRQVLANETEKAAVEINFVTAAAVTERGFFARIAAACRESGDWFADSIASLILVAASLIPWLLVLAPAAWGLARLFRRLRRKRTAPAPPPTVSGQA